MTSRSRSGAFSASAACPVHKAAALSLAQLRRLVSTCDTSARGRRDRALLLIGFAGALRRSELVGLPVEDVTPEAGSEAQAMTTR